MLYLFIGAILAIGVNSQCTQDSDCDSTAASGLGACVDYGSGIMSCGACNVDADCQTSYWTTLWNDADNIECSDPLSVGANACYPPTCTVDGDCASGYSCTGGYCISLAGFGCSDDSECSTGETCYVVSSVGVCVTGTFGCTSDSDCESGQGCVTVSGISACVTGITSCTSDSDCSDPYPTCETTTYNICYASCSTDADCSSGTCDADTATGIKGCSFDTDTTATGCTGDSDCAGDLICNTDDGSCVVCTGDSDCESDESCLANLCLSTACSTDADCLLGYCRSDTCVICETDKDCTDDILYGTGYTCQTVAGVNVCSNVDLGDDDGINQITGYVAMIIMAFVAVNM